MLDYSKTKIAFPLMVIAGFVIVLFGGASKINALENKLERDKLGNEFRIEVVRLQGELTGLKDTVEKMREEQQA